MTVGLPVKVRGWMPLRIAFCIGGSLSTWYGAMLGFTWAGFSGPDCERLILNVCVFVVASREARIPAIVILHNLCCQNTTGRKARELAFGHCISLYLCHNRIENVCEDFLVQLDPG